MEKKGKYKDLELEIQTMWHMKTVVRKGRSACWGLHESSGRCSVYDDVQQENQQRL